MKPIYVHGGNPKAFSTSLQNVFASNHNKALMYCGFIPQNESNNWYEHSFVSKFLNYDLRISSTRSFEKNLPLYRDKFSEILENSTLPNLISSENLMMRFSFTEIEVEEKLARLARTFESIGAVKLIGVFRPILSSCQSIYLEYLKQGYTEDFTYFQSESQLLADSNFIDSLIPAYICKLSEDIPNLEFVFIAATGDSFADKLAEGFKRLVPELNFDLFPSMNINQTKGRFLSLMEHNKNRHNVVDTLGLIENHRVFWHEAASEHLRWQKLRARTEIRELMASQPEIHRNLPAFNSEFRDFVADRWEMYGGAALDKAGACIAGRTSDLYDL